MIDVQMGWNTEGVRIIYMIIMEDLKLFISLVDTLQ